MTKIPSDLKLAMKALRSQGIMSLVYQQLNILLRKNDECTNQFISFSRNFWSNGLGTWYIGYLLLRKEDTIPIGANVISLICKVIKM